MLQIDLHTSYDNSEFDDDVFDDDPFYNKDDDQSFRVDNDLYKSVRLDEDD